MAFGTPPQPSATRVYVGTAAPPATLVGGIVGWGFSGEKEIQENKFYNTFPPITSIDVAVRGITFSMKYSKADTGQDVLFTNFKLVTPTVIYGSILVDGTTGQYIPCAVTTWTLGGPGSSQFADLNVTLSGQGDAVDVGGGF